MNRDAAMMVLGALCVGAGVLPVRLLDAFHRRRMRRWYAKHDALQAEIDRRRRERIEHVLGLRAALGLSMDVDPSECCPLCGMLGSPEEPCDAGMHS